MFVKIMYWNVRKNEDQSVIYSGVEREIIYNPLSAELTPIPSGEENKEIKMSLVIDFGNNNKETIFFPCESPDKVVEIYYMNDEGKTVERYVY